MKKIVVVDIVKYRIDIAAKQEINGKMREIWIENYIFLYVGLEDRQLDMGTGLVAHNKIFSSLKRMEFVSDTLS